MLNSAVEEEGEGAREQPQDLEQAQHGQNHICSKEKGAANPLGQMSTIGVLRN